MKGDALDPKGLFVEAYRMEGITAGECRSIFLDWALSFPDGQDMAPTIKKLIDRYRPDNADHPMTEILIQALEKSAATRRRGGWRSRNRD